MSARFIKMHGLGNDFVVFDERAAPLGLTAARAAAIADRHTGIGCDQLISIEKPPAGNTADAAMRIRNADGSEAGACGNAARCVAELLFRESGQSIRVIRTAAGNLPAERLQDGLIRVDMGPPRLGWQDIPLSQPMDTLHLDLHADGLNGPAACSMGNPHATFFVPDLESVAVAAIGPGLERAALFPERANIGFVQVLSPERLRLRVWERGAGLTRACGSGACAALVNAHRRGLAARQATVLADGGELAVEWRDDGHVLMTGPVATAFHGTLDLTAYPGMSVDIVTFGCRLNAYESEVIRDLAAGCDGTIVVNTCAVTAEAERQARQTVRRLARERPDARIVVTGCAAQIDPASWAGLPGVARVLGNREKLEAASWAAGAPGAVSDIMGARETAPHLVTGFAGRARAFVQVQQGCDHRCTFCIIPFGRGPSGSVPVGAVVAQVRALVEAGYREVVLTGVDITSYGADLPGRPTLGQLVRRVLALVPELPRLRLSSLDPTEIDDELWRLVAEEARLMPHLHLSLQAGSDLILKRMKRRHSRADALAAIARARCLRPGIAIGADLIAGFPTETEALFAETLSLVEGVELPFLHVFPYSARGGTPAARMPQVPHPERRERAARLRVAGRRNAAAFFEGQLGRVVSVLTESGDAGHTEHYVPVQLAAPVSPGQLIQARVRRVTEDGLIAEPC